MVASSLASTFTDWYAAGGLGFLIWVILLIFFGVKTLRNGHWVLFLLGFVVPILWIVGVLVPPRPSSP